jgi:hypothetical protein
MRTSVTNGLPHGKKAWELIHDRTVPITTQKQEFKHLIIAGEHEKYGEVEIREDGNRTRLIKLNKPEAKTKTTK